jgi:uncharacterized protein (TIGR04255 family)
LQRALKSDFPLVDVQEQFAIKVTIGDRPELTDERRAVSTTLYQFSPADQSVKLTVNSDFIAVSTSRYAEWAEYKRHISTALNGLCAVYDPGTFSRVGLRYVNRLKLVDLGLDGRSATELFNSELVGPLTSLGSRVFAQKTTLRVHRDNDSDVQLTFGLDSDDDGAAYTIDTDVFTTASRQADTATTLSLLDGFNREIGNAFRWAISPLVENALNAD